MRLNLRSITARYLAPSESIWQGREDSDGGLRLHQRVQCLDLQQVSKLPKCSGRKTLVIGFASDEGIRRNFGRIGAAEGPIALRKAAVNFPWSFLEEEQVYDVGTVHCQGGDLEAAQRMLGEVVSWGLAQGARTIVLGGGHELAWGHYLGIDSVKKWENVGVVNFDAHFDIRPLSTKGLGSSGTSFLQIAHRCKENNKPFRYLCLGVQPAGNTSTLFRAAKDLGVTYVEAPMFWQQPASVSKTIDEFTSQCDALYVSLCLDMFAEGFAPGVSAPQAQGLLPFQVSPFLTQVLGTKKVVAMDIAELSPPHDHQGMTARLAASYLHTFLVASS